MSFAKEPGGNSKEGGGDVMKLVEAKIQFEKSISEQNEKFTQQLREQIEQWKQMTLKDDEEKISTLIQSIRLLNEELALKKSKKTEIEATISTRCTSYEGLRLSLCNDDLHKVKHQTDKFVETQVKALEDLNLDIQRSSTNLEKLTKEHKDFLLHKILIKDLEKEQANAENQLKLSKAYLREQCKHLEKLGKCRGEYKKYDAGWKENIKTIETKLRILSDNKLEEKLPEPSTETDKPAVTNDVSILDDNTKVTTGNFKRKAEVMIEMGKCGVKVMTIKSSASTDTSLSKSSHASTAGSDTVSPAKIPRFDDKNSGRIKETNKQQDAPTSSHHHEKKRHKKDRRPSKSGSVDHHNHSSRNRYTEGESSKPREKAVSTHSYSSSSTATKLILQKESKVSKSNDTNLSKTKKNNNNSNNYSNVKEKEVQSHSPSMNTNISNRTKKEESKVDENVKKLSRVLDTIYAKENGQLATQILEYLVFLQDPDTKGKKSQYISQSFITTIVGHTISYEFKNNFSNRIIEALSILKTSNLISTEIMIPDDDDEDSEGGINHEDYILIQINSQYEDIIIHLVLSKDSVPKSFKSLLFSCQKEITNLKNLLNHSKYKIVLNFLWNIVRNFQPTWQDDDSDNINKNEPNPMTSHEFLILNSRHNLAVAFEEIGYYSKAHHLLIENNKLLTSRFHVENFYNVLKNKSCLSTVLKALGKYSDALDLASQVYHRRVCEYGMSGSVTLESLNEIALILLAQGNFEEALDKLNFVYNAHRKAKGEEHESTTNSRHNIACLLLERGSENDLEEARKIFVRIHEIIFQKSRQAGGNSTDNNSSDMMDSKADNFTDDLLWVKECLGEVYLAQNKATLALEALTPVYIRYIRIHGIDHPSTLEAFRNVGKANACQGNFEDAREIFDDILRTQTALVGEDNPETIQTLYEKSSLLAQTGELSDAVELLQKVYDYQLKIFGSEHYKTRKTEDKMKCTKRLLVQKQEQT